MAALIKVKVTRPAWLQGRAVKPGATVTLPAAEAQSAVAGGRCELADEVERAHLVAAMRADWQRLAERPAFQPPARTPA